MTDAAAPEPETPTVAGFFRELLSRFPALFAVNFTLLLVSGLLESVTLLTLVPIIDGLALPDLAQGGPITQRFAAALGFLGVAPTLTHLFAALIAFQTLASAFSILAYHSILRTKYAVERDLLLGSFRDFFGARWYFFSSHSHGTLLNTFQQAVGKAAEAFGNLAAMLVLVTRAFFILLVPLTLAWQVTLLSASLGALLVWPFLRLGRFSYGWGQLNTSTGNRLMGALYENLGSAKIILGFGNQALAAEKLSEAFDAHCRITLKSQTLNQAIHLGYRPMSLVVLAAALFAARRIGLPLSEIAVILVAFVQAAPLAGQLAANRNLIQNLLPHYEQIKSLRSAARRLEQRSGGRTFTDFSELTLDGVSFSYPDRPPVLTDIHLRIPKGRFAAVVGESGAGKSTLIDLIMALQEPTAGRIAFDGVPLEDFDMRSYRQRIGYVPQDAVLFDQSIRDNLLWARPGATDEEIRAACREANAAEFIEKMPSGYDTLVGDRGVRLSGGQAQRISLARAILRRPPLLILDEATSALDTHSERLIQRAIEGIAKETTVIAIAHRLSTIMNAGHIVLLKDGRVAEEGTYAGLVQRGGLFSRMVESQALTGTNA